MANVEGPLVTFASDASAPGWALWMRKCTDYLAQDFLGGPRPWKFSWVINFQKGGIFFLFTGGGAGLGMAGLVCGEHGVQRGQHVALPCLGAYKKRSWWLVPFVL